VMVRQLVLDRNPYLCWLTKGLNPDGCNKDTAYDLWQRLPASSSDHAAHNVYEYSSSAGGWGGWCTCPDGQRYNVGDLNDGCANGPASLACFGGTPGECERHEDADRLGMTVTCATLTAMRDAPTNVYEHSSAVGGWGGWCTCPDGQRYNVGDRNDSCANGPASLACFGGSPGECERHEESARKGMQVTCAIVE